MPFGEKFEIWWTFGWEYDLSVFMARMVFSGAPLLHLRIFRNRTFTVSAFVTVVGMFGFVATGYRTSIRLGPIQHQGPLHATAAFVVFNGGTPLPAPLTSRLVEHVSPRWILSRGLVPIGGGNVWAATVPISAGPRANPKSRGMLVAPLAIPASRTGTVLTATALIGVTVNPKPSPTASSGPTIELRLWSVAVNSAPPTAPHAGAVPLAVDALGG